MSAILTIYLLVCVVEVAAGKHESRTRDLLIDGKHWYVVPWSYDNKVYNAGYKIIFCNQLKDLMWGCSPN